MKKLRNWISWHIEDVFLLVVFALSLSFGFVCAGGCSTGKGQLNPATGVYDPGAAADVAVVTAQNLREAALGVFDSFMFVEKNNDAALRVLNPKIHETAEIVRRDGRKYLDDLTASITAYQSARTPDNASKLKSALAAVNSLLISATQQLAEATTRKAP